MTASPFQFSAYQPRDLEIIDTTLREGSQTSLLHDRYKYFFSQTDKVELVKALIVYGVKFIELFCPLVSPREREDFGAIKAARDSLITQKGYTFLLAHVRCHPADVEAAIAAGFDGLNFYIGTSAESRKHNHGQDLTTLTGRAGKLLADVRRNHPQLVLRFSGEDAFRTPETELFRVYDEIAPYVDRLGTPDTVGVATPQSVANRLATLHQRYPKISCEGHFHNDRGYAMVNGLTAVRSGMRYINTSLLGFGERSGITSMTGLLFNLFIEKEFDKLEGYHLRGSYPINILMADKMHMLVPATEPVSLTNRTHTAGVHQKAIINDPSTYEAQPLDQFGVSESEMLLGPLSGWNVIHYFLHEIKGFHLDEGLAKKITAVFKEKVYEIDPDQSPAEFLLKLVQDEFQLAQITHPEPFRDSLVQNLSTSGDV